MISSLEYNLEIESNTTKVQLTKIESTSRLAKNGKIENTRCHIHPLKAKTSSHAVDVSC
ncbi:hypothetical protein Hanom_Chr04g00307991 [Helianthus anomalus]